MPADFTHELGGLDTGDTISDGDIIDQDLFSSSRRTFLSGAGATAALALIGCRTSEPTVSSDVALPPLPTETVEPTALPVLVQPTIAPSIDVDRPTPTQGVDVDEPTPTPDIIVPRSGEFSAQPTILWNFSEKTGSVEDFGWRIDIDPRVPTWRNLESAYTDNPRNVRTVKGEGLVIQAHVEEYIYPGVEDPINYEITSARIDTRPQHTAEYGRWTFEAVMPEGAGVHPAIWLVSHGQPHYVGREGERAGDSRFYLHNGEIDLVEFYGHIPGSVDSTVHVYQENAKEHIRVPLPSVSDGLHTYTLELTPEGLKTHVDDQLMLDVQRNGETNPEVWPFQGGNTLYPLMTIALGSRGGGEVDRSVYQNNPDAWKMVVRSAAFYEYSV